jgi:hypothetical protein
MYGENMQDAMGKRYEGNIAPKTHNLLILIESTSLTLDNDDLIF